MSDQEKKVLDLTVQLWNAYQALPSHHPDENNELRLYIHQIQGLFASRFVYPTKYPNTDCAIDFDSSPIGGFKD